MDEMFRGDGQANSAGLCSADAVREVVVVVVVVSAVLVWGVAVVVMSLRVGRVVLMDDAQTFKQAMRRSWHPGGSQDQR